MKCRVKLYSLEDDGSWNDKGAGRGDIENGAIVVVFDDQKRFVSKLTNNPDFYQLEGGIVSFVKRLLIFRHIDCFY
jgi:hypothetical protein